MAEPIEVFCPVLFLASDEAVYVNGACVNGAYVNGTELVVYNVFTST